MHNGMVLGSERVDDDGVNTLRVRANDIDTVSLPQYAPAGDDSPPLLDDTSVYDEDAEAILGYIDTRNAGVALPGEKRLYARDESGEIVGHVFLRRDGTLELGLNATGFVAVAGLVDARFARIRSDINALKGAISDGFDAVGAGSSASGTAGKEAFEQAAGGLPSALPTVASQTVKVQP